MKKPNMVKADLILHIAEFEAMEADAREQGLTIDE
jgi:hypothetical protein